MTMADYPVAVTTGDKSFGASNDNHGVLIGDASGHAQVIGTLRPLHLPVAANDRQAHSITITIIQASCKVIIRPVSFECPH